MTNEFLKKDEYRAGLEPDHPGVGRSPMQPQCLFPINRSAVETDLILDAGDFIDPDGDAYIASQWRIYDSQSGIALLDVSSKDTASVLAQAALVDPTAWASNGTTPTTLPDATVAYKLILHHPGQRAVITVHLTDPAPPGSKWIKYDSVNGWQDYTRHTVFSADRRSVCMEAKDGGYGDADGLANGIILDPAGLSTPAVVAPPATGSGGGVGCFITTTNSGNVDGELGCGPRQWLSESIRRITTLMGRFGPRLD